MATNQEMREKVEKWFSRMIEQAKENEKAVKAYDDLKTTKGGANDGRIDKSAD